MSYVKIVLRTALTILNEEGHLNSKGKHRKLNRKLKGKKTNAPPLTYK